MAMYGAPVRLRDVTHGLGVTVRTSHMGGGA